MKLEQPQATFVWGKDAKDIPLDAHNRGPVILSDADAKKARAALEDAKWEAVLPPRIFPVYVLEQESLRPVLVTVEGAHHQLYVWAPARESDLELPKPDQELPKPPARKPGTLPTKPEAAPVKKAPKRAPYRPTNDPVVTKKTPAKAAPARKPVPARKHR